MMESSCILKKWFSKHVVRRETCSCAAQLCNQICRRLQLKCDGTRWRTGGEVKGKLANVVGSQYSSHHLRTWCIQHYYRWCAHLGCQQSTELTPTGRFKRTRPFRRKTKSDFCACAITFQLAITNCPPIQTQNFGWQKLAPKAVSETKGYGLSRYDAVWLGVWFPAFLVNVQPLRYRLYQQFYASVYGDSQKIIKDGSKLHWWMSWGDPLEYQEKKESET